MPAHRHHPAIVRMARHMPGRLLRPLVVARRAPIESVKISNLRGAPLRSTAARTINPRARASKTVIGSDRRHGVEK